jgi:hypothetical protein
MTYQWLVVLGVLCPTALLAEESYPLEVSDYIERREVCEHFRQEPWPEGSSTEDKGRREFIAAQSDRYCKGTDQAIRELKRKYKNDKSVIKRLEKYETDIEGKQ